MPPKYEFSDFCLMNKKLCLSKGFKDQISEKLFPSDGPKGLEPKQTFGDGNCLYRAMSKIICGNENRHVELRVRTFIELCLNRDKYLNNSYLKELTGLDDYMENLLGSSFDLSSKTKGKPKSERQREGFEAGIVDNIKPGTYSTMWHIFALSNILGFPIQTVYPDVRGSLVDRNYVNVRITPSHMQHPSVAYVMWTHAECRPSWLDTKPFCSIVTSTLSGCSSTISSYPKLSTQRIKEKTSKSTPRTTFSI